MQISRKHLSKFDFQPFITIAADSDGFVIYKNHMAEKLCPKIRAGAGLHRYTDISLDSSISVCDFYGESSIALSHRLTDEDGQYHLIIVFSEGCCKYFLKEGAAEEYQQLINTFLADSSKSSDSSLKLFARNAINNYNLMKCWGNFNSLFVKNSKEHSKQSATPYAFFSEISSIAQKRLGIELTILTQHSDIDDCFVNLDHHTIALIMNFLSFIIGIAKSKCIKTESVREGEDVKITFDFEPTPEFYKIFLDGTDSAFIFALMTGVFLASERGTRYALSNNDGRAVISLYLPYEKPCEYSFSQSSEFISSINDFISFYLSLSQE